MNLTLHAMLKPGFHFNPIVTYRSIFFCVEVISSTLVVRKQRNTLSFATIRLKWKTCLRESFGKLKFTRKDEYCILEHFYVFFIEMFLDLGCDYYGFIKKNRFVQVTSYFKGTWQYTMLLSHLKELLRLYIILIYHIFSYLAYFYQYFDWKEWNVCHLQFLQICM
jgi:hypothetical protein